MMNMTEDWVVMVGFVGALIRQHLTEKQVDRIYKACDLFIDGEKKKASRRLAYWAKKIGLDTIDRFWIFEWYCS